MRVIITGAAGKIGNEMVDELTGLHDLCLMDRSPLPGRASIVADLAQGRSWIRWRPGSRRSLQGWAKAFEGADVVLHLAAERNPEAPWEQVLRDNIQVTQNVIEAAIQHRIPRVIFASSNWVVKGLEQALAPACYAPGGPKIGSDAAPYPLTAYGISKAFGEHTGRMVVAQRKLGSFMAVRIGAFKPNPPKDEENRRLWIGTRDLRRLLLRCTEVETEGFHVVYGVSAQPTAPYDLSYTHRLLSWEPSQLPCQGERGESKYQTAVSGQLSAISMGHAAASRQQWADKTVLRAEGKEHGAKRS